LLILSANGIYGKPNFDVEDVSKGAVDVGGSGHYSNGEYHNYDFNATTEETPDPTPEEEIVIESIEVTRAQLHIHTRAHADMVELLVVSRAEIVGSPLVLTELLSNLTDGPEVMAVRRMHIAAVFDIQDGYDAPFIIGNGDISSVGGFMFFNHPLEPSTTYFSTAIYVKRPALEAYPDVTARPDVGTRRSCISADDIMFRHSRTFRTRFRYHTMIYAALMISMLIATMCLGIFLIRVMCDIMAGSAKTKSTQTKPSEPKAKPNKELKFKHDNMKLVFTTQRAAKDDKDLLVGNMIL